MDIHWTDHLMAQAVWQDWIGNAIAKTINMPNDVSAEDVKAAYLLAHELGLKGITVYRDGSRSGVLVAADEKTDKELENDVFKETKAPARPKRLDAKVVRFQNNKEKWIAVVGLLNGRPY